ncbi:hypothetical protein PSHT_14067 [Puccinia striiformis]|uniref:CxC1-like cysteine cluster associated with KDZ transposases domain-containing protein n=1 Tax=Puccinia striiformis TaxID=27350 RepID=A0A2S4UMB6_9BASI|nr:hypothetical protein PSHT_14067 [Puccinia striiformis]
MAVNIKVTRHTHTPKTNGLDITRTPLPTTTFRSTPTWPLSRVTLAINNSTAWVTHQPHKAIPLAITICDNIQRIHPMPPTTNCQSDGPFGPVISGCGSVQTRLASVVPQDSLPGSSHTPVKTLVAHPMSKTPALPSRVTTCCAPNIRQINCILKNLAKDRQPAIAQPSAQSAPPGEEETLPNEGESGVAGDNEGIETKDVPTSLHRGTGCNENDILPAEDQNGEGDNGGDIDNEGDTRIDEVPDDVLEEISGMDLDELREYESLHAENKRLPAYLKAELDDMYYEFERQLHIFAIRFQLHVALLYMHIGLVNKMRGATNYNNFCRFDPKAREIFAIKEEPLKQRCKDVAKVWATIDPEIKSKYKDPAYIETIRGDVPMLVVNGCIQTARKTHVANTSLNLACNQKSTTFVRRWAHDTIQRMNELYSCHRIQGFLVIASGKSSGDLFVTGGTPLGVSFLNMLMKAGDPLRKFHTLAAGMAVIDELVNGTPADTSEKSIPGPVVQKRKHADIGIMEAEDAEKTDEYTNGNLKANKKEISKQLKKMLNDAGGKTFSGWPGKNAAHDLGKANIQVKVKKNTDNLKRFSSRSRQSTSTSRRILRAIGEGWIHIKYQEDSERASSPVDNITNQAEPAAKKVKLNRKAANKRSNQKKSTLDDDSEEEVPTRCCQIAHLGFVGCSPVRPKTAFSVRLLQHHNLAWPWCSVATLPFTEYLSRWLEERSERILM